MRARAGLFLTAAVITALLGMLVESVSSRGVSAGAAVTLPTLSTTTTAAPTTTTAPPPWQETHQYMTNGAACEPTCHNLDVYYSTRTAAQPRPAVIFIHQGGWVGGSYRDGISGFASALVKTYHPDWVAFSISYTLDSPNFVWPAPATPPPAGAYPVQPNEVVQALEWVQNQAATYNIDPSKIGVLGGSAGAHLAALLGASQPGAPGSFGKPAAVAEWSGPTNMAAILSDQGCSNTVCNPSAQYAGAAVENFEGKCLPTAPAPGPNFRQCPDSRYAQTSGVTFVNRCSPPMYLAHSQQDTVVPFEQEQQLASGLYNAGVPYQQLIVYAGSSPPPTLTSQPYNQGATYQADANAANDHSYYWSSNASSHLPWWAEPGSFNFFAKYLVQSPYQPTGC